MVNNIHPVVYWVPRVLSILLIAFLALMSLDIFVPGATAGEIALALLTHNIPVFVLIAVLAVAWKYEIVGGIGYIAAGLLYAGLIISSMLRDGFQGYLLTWILEISGVAILTGTLFLVGWFQKQKLENKK